MQVPCRSLITLLLLAMPISAAAQLRQDTTATTQQPSTVTSSGSTVDANRWLASGFVGSNFGNNANPASMDVGATFTYLRNNRYGAEVNVGITPDFQLQNNFFSYGNKPMVNSYMANAIWTRPLGGEKQIQPYISGGIGAISLRTQLANVTTTFDEMKTRFGGTIGGGAMVFLGPWGFKAGLEYYRATGSYSTAYAAPPSGSSTSPSASPGSPTPSPTPSPNPGPYIRGMNPARAATAPVVVNGLDAATAASLTDSALSGLHYWRGNAGVVLRW